MIATAQEKQVLDLAKLGREDPSEFMIKALDVKRRHMWPKMIEVNNSVRDNDRTAVGAGHGVSKTYDVARLCLTFLVCHIPSTVVTTAPTGMQVKDLLWREIRDAHAHARIPLGGKLTTTMLDMQPETGRRWFATGFSTKPDTVTQEATAFQGYHNEYLLIAFDEAAGILPEIWRAAEHIGAPYKRFIAIGNVTSGVGPFPESLVDPTFNYINISVLDTPNYKKGKMVIPGVYGREYVSRIKTKYGEDSDEFRVRVRGLTSQKAIRGSYYTAKINNLRRLDRVGHITHNPNYEVYIVVDIGYTSSFWFVQNIGTNIHFIDYYEDSGVSLDNYARLFCEWSRTKGYKYADMIVPCDMDSNATRIITGESALETMRGLGFRCVPLAKEIRVFEGIERTRRFLDMCYFSESCNIGLGKCEAYHESINKQLSTDENPIYTGVPAKDGNDHAADALRYVSKAAKEDKLRSRASGGMSKQRWRQLKAQYA